MKNVLVIVAHPDDETIWMGGLLLEHKDWKVTIISLCRKYDKDRSLKFKKACKIFKAKYHISDLEDEKLIDIPREEIIKRIKKFCKNKKYDYIFTHGKNGEYGHKRHLDINKAVEEMIKNKLLLSKKVFFFSYLKNKKFCYPNRNADKFIKIKVNTFNRKKSLIKEVYGFNENSFEEKSCKSEEAFIIKNNK